MCVSHLCGPLCAYILLCAHIYRDLCSSNFSSLEVSFPHLGAGAAILAIWLADVPNDMLLIFDEVLTEIVIEMFPHYATVSYIHIRYTNLSSVMCIDHCMPRVVSLPVVYSLFTYGMIFTNLYVILWNIIDL